MKLTRTDKEIIGADRFRCSECDGEFIYGPGFPDYCPECGEEVTETEDAAALRSGDKS